jgi:hypothetical protein
MTTKTRAITAVQRGHHSGVRVMNDHLAPEAVELAES